MARLRSRPRSRQRKSSEPLYQGTASAVRPRSPFILSSREMTLLRLCGTLRSDQSIRSCSSDRQSNQLIRVTLAVYQQLEVVVRQRFRVLAIEVRKRDRFYVAADERFHEGALFLGG